MNRLAKEGLLDRLTKVKLPQCESCLAGKTTAKPFGKASTATTPLKLINSDICGPMSVKARHGANHFLTFMMTIRDMGMCTYYLITMKHLKYPSAL